MGNRATVVFAESRVAVYLHWNGGPESVYAFLAETRRRMGSRWYDPDYSPARFVQTVGDFFDAPYGSPYEGRSSTSLGVCAVPATSLGVPVVHATGEKAGSVVVDQKQCDIREEDLARTPTDHSDNGFYIVAGGEIVARYHENYRELADGSYSDALKPFQGEEIDREKRSAVHNKTYRAILADFLKADSALYGSPKVQDLGSGGSKLKTQPKL